MKFGKVIYYKIIYKIQLCFHILAMQNWKTKSKDNTIPNSLGEKVIKLTIHAESVQNTEAGNQRHK